MRARARACVHVRACVRVRASVRVCVRQCECVSGARVHAEEHRSDSEVSMTLAPLVTTSSITRHLHSLTLSLSHSPTLPLSLSLSLSLSRHDVLNHQAPVGARGMRTCARTGRMGLAGAGTAGGGLRCSDLTSRVPARPPRPRTRAATHRLRRLGPLLNMPRASFWVRRRVLVICARARRAQAPGVRTRARPTREGRMRPPRACRTGRYRRKRTWRPWRRRPPPSSWSRSPWPPFAAEPGTSLAASRRECAREGTIGLRSAQILRINPLPPPPPVARPGCKDRTGEKLKPESWRSPWGLDAPETGLWRREGPCMALRIPGCHKEQSLLREQSFFDKLSIYKVPTNSFPSTSVEYRKAMTTRNKTEKQSAFASQQHDCHLTLTIVAIRITTSNDADSASFHNSRAI